MTTDVKLNITKESACFSKRFLICNFNLVNLPDQFWNTLWPDLVRVDKELAKLNINPEDIKTI